MQNSPLPAISGAGFERLYNEVIRRGETAMENRRHYSHLFSFALPVVVLAGVRAESIPGFALSIFGCLFMAALYAGRLKFPVETPWRWSVMAGMVYVVALIGLKYVVLATLSEHSWLLLIVAVAMPLAMGALVARWTDRS